MTYKELKAKIRSHPFKPYAPDPEDDPEGRPWEPGTFDVVMDAYHAGALTYKEMSGLASAARTAANE